MMRQPERAAVVTLSVFVLWRNLLENKMIFSRHCLWCFFGVIRCNMAALSAIQLHCTSLDCTDRHRYAGTKWLKTPHMHRPFLLSNCQLIYNEKLMLRENYLSAYSYFFLFLSWFVPGVRFRSWSVSVRSWSKNRQWRKTQGSPSAGGTLLRR